MACKISFKASVEKDLKRIDRQNTVIILDRIDTDLAAHPGKDKPLKNGLKGLYSYRIGSFRVIYSLDRKTDLILILRISHRKDSYR